MPVRWHRVLGLVRFLRIVLRGVGAKPLPPIFLPPGLSFPYTSFSTIPYVVFHVVDHPLRIACVPNPLIPSPF